MCKDNGILVDDIVNIEPYAVKGSGNSRTSPPEFVSEIKACNSVIHSIDQVLIFETKDERKEKEKKDKIE
jgi:hypothetical protein